LEYKHDEGETVGIADDQANIFSSAKQEQALCIYVKHHNRDNSGAYESAMLVTLCSKCRSNKELTRPRLSNANQSPVPVGNKPILRHFHNPTARVNKLHKRYTNFCSGRVVMDFAEEVVGANGANAVAHRERLR
jgi:hypothetical protein